MRRTMEEKEEEKNVYIMENSTMNKKVVKILRK